MPTGTDLPAAPPVIGPAPAGAALPASLPANLPANLPADSEFRQLFTANPAPMLIYERGSLAVVAVNQAFERQYGHSLAQARQLRLTDLYRPQDQAALRQLTEQLHGLASAGQWWHLRRDGSLLQVVVQSHDIRYEQRDCRVAVITDLTPLKRAEATLAAERDRLRLAQYALDQAADLVIWFHPDGRLHYVNEAACRFLGHTREALLALPAQALLDDWSPTALALAWPRWRRRAAAGGADGEVRECALRGADGQPRPVALRTTVVVDADGVETAFVLGTGIAARQREAQRQHNRLALLENLASGHSLPRLLTQLVQDHEALFPGTLASVLLLEAATGRMRVGAAPSLPADCLAAVDGLPIGPEVLGCGAAMHRGQRVVSADIATDPNWSGPAFERLRQRVLEAGVRASWSEPILGAGGQVLGALAMYLPQPGEPSAEAVEHARFGVQLAATAIQHAASVQAMAEQTRLIDTMFSQTTDAIVLLDPQTGRFVNFNDAACAGLGYSREAFARLNPLDLQDELSPAQIGDLHARVLAGEPVRLPNTRHRRADGSIQHAELTLRLLTVSGRPLVSAVWRDITEAHRNAQRIQRLNRAYAVLSDVNEAVVRLRHPQQLMDELCRIAVSVGGLRLVWVGRRSDDGQHVLPVAHAGHSDGFIERLRPRLRPPEGPGALALHSGQPCVIDDVQTDPRTAHLREAARQRGYCSAAAFPVVVDDQTRYCLCVCGDSTGSFDAEMAVLLTRLAQDLGHALEFIAAQEAQRREQRFREQLIESVAGLFYVIDAQGHLLLWNRQFEQTVGLPPEQIAGRPAGDFFLPAERPLIERRLREVLAQGQAEVEAWLLPPGGGVQRRFLFVSRRVALERAHGGGDEQLIVGTGIDITERVRTEQALAHHRQQLKDEVAERTAELQAANARLHREDQRLRAVLTLSQQASGLSEQQLFERGVEAAAQLSGSALAWVFSVTELAGEAAAAPLLALEAATPGLAPALLARLAGTGPWQQTAADGQPRRVDAELTPAQAPAQAGPGLLCVPVAEDGRVRLVLCIAEREPAFGEDDERELLLLAHDLWRIARRRRIEIALQRAKLAADAANQAKSAFLANMSHEIRTPMNAIVGFAHLLKRDPLTPRQLDNLAKINDAGQHLLQLINDVLDFSKIEAHKITLAEDDFPLRHSIERVTTMLADKARSKQVQLTVDTAGCPPRVRGDRLRLEQILLNLIGNAVKFTHQGQVSVRVVPLALAADAPEDGLRLRFSVEDTGIGMRESQVPHLFEAFEQADASTTRRYGGTGLGLAICKRLAELMGGRIGVSSRLGLGSTFWFELPLRLPLAEPGPAPWPAEAVGAPPSVDDVAQAIAHSQLRGVRVLLAEDNVINQEVASALLQALGAQVDVADDGRAAVQRVAQAPYDLVLMDVQMPQMDGLRATRAIRAMPGLAGLPIIAMTANAFDDDRAACLAAGMDDYLAKPVEPRALLACLTRWLAAGNARRPAAGPTPAGDGQTDPVRKRLQEALPGLQLAPALARMRGSWPLYLRTLQLFAQHHQGDVALLCDDSTESARAAWRQIGHSVAGAAATLGALDLARQAQALQQALAAGEPAGAQAQSLASGLALLLDEITAALHAPPAPDDSPPRADSPRPNPAADWPAVQRCLQALVPLVDSHDTAAPERIEADRALLQAALGPLAQTLEQQLQNFSFEEAQQTLARALALAAQPPVAG